MNRRDLITLLGGAAAAWPLAARAQQARKLPIIGYLGASTPAGQGQWLAAFKERLRELGWIEDRMVAIEVRWAENRAERYAEIAAEFVRLKVDVIATLGIAVPAAKRATSSIPIVFAVDADPVGSGLVGSLARPGGNVTGLSSSRRILPASTYSSCERSSPACAAWRFGQCRLAWCRAGDERGSGSGLCARPRHRRQARNPPRRRHRARLRRAQERGTGPLRVQRPTRGHQPGSYHHLGARRATADEFVRREYIEAGGLMAYGPNFLDLNRRAADFVDKILRGTKPADIPVEQPTKFDLIINLTTAKALGLDVPPMLLARADEVIE